MCADRRCQVTEAGWLRATSTWTPITITIIQDRFRIVLMCHRLACVQWGLLASILWSTWVRNLVHELSYDDHWCQSLIETVAMKIVEWIPSIAINCVIDADFGVVCTLVRSTLDFSSVKIGCSLVIRVPEHMSSWTIFQLYRGRTHLAGRRIWRYCC